MWDKIEKRQLKNKQELLEQLKKTPIIQIACGKSNISRATYYRWRNEDKEFAQSADKAIDEGSALVNDIAESQLLNAIKQQNLTAIIFWLKHHHAAYANKIELTARFKADEEILTPEQEKLVTRALKIVSLMPKEDKDVNSK